MIKRIYSKLKAKGIGGSFAALRSRVFPSRLSCFKRNTGLFENKIGFEIGGPSGVFKRTGLLPIYTIATRIDNCNFSRQTIWEGAIQEGATFRYDKKHAPGNQYVAEASDLHRLASGTYDFLLSSHTLEHTANPIKALAEWIRILKEEGVLVLILPHKDGTFDHRRPVTCLKHMIEDFERKMTEDDLTHMEEILRLHDLGRDPWAGDFESFKQRSKKNLENRCLHHHVFDTRLAIEVVNHMGLQILEVDAFQPCNILVLARKPSGSDKVQNDRFRSNKPLSWHSPFPSDQSSNR